MWGEPQKSGGKWGCVEENVYLCRNESSMSVSMRFLGNIEAKLDAKGRVFLPAAFRKVLQGAGEQGMVMRKDVFQACLVLYPESVWGEQMDSLRRRLSQKAR